MVYSCSWNPEDCVCKTQDLMARCEYAFTDLDTYMQDRPARPASGVEFPLKARLWLRTSVTPPEWVLEIEGSINGCGFISRHTEPATTKPEDAVGLPSLYARAQ